MSPLGPVHLADPPLQFIPGLKTGPMGRHSFGDSPRHADREFAPGQKRRCKDSSHSCTPWETWGAKDTQTSADLPCPPPYPNRRVLTFLPWQPNGWGARGKILSEA